MTAHEDRYGTLEKTDGGAARLRFTRALSHPIERVWAALVEAEQLAKWFPTTIEGERVAGAPLTFSFPGGQFPSFDGEMVAFEPPHACEFRWGPDTIRIELRQTAEGTELTLLDTLEETGKAARDGAGWHTCLDALGAALDGSAAARNEMNRWADVHSHYVAAFPAEASTIGPPEGMDVTAAADV